MMELGHHFLLLCLFVLAALQKANGCGKEPKKPVDGKFGAWSEWTKCHVSCGPGSHGRKRHCNNPAPKNKGRKCSGATSQTRSCYVWKDSCRDNCFSFPVTNASAGVGARVVLKPLRKLEGAKAFTLDVDVTMRGRWPYPQQLPDFEYPVWGPTIVGFSRKHGVGYKYHGVHLYELLWLTAEARLIINGEGINNGRQRVLGKGPSEEGLRTPEINRRERYTVTWDGRSGKTVLYINGIKEAEASKKQQGLARYGPLGYGDPGSAYHRPHVFMLGQHQVRPSIHEKYKALQQFMGDLCNFQMWDRVLNEGELKALFQGKGVPQANVFDNPPTYEYELKGGAKVKSEQ